jgi:beta-glucanase (GH16 family)
MKAMRISVWMAVPLFSALAACGQSGKSSTPDSAATGGSASTDGATGSGGATGTGGKTGSGGATGAGGATGEGGTTASDAGAGDGTGRDASFLAMDLATDSSDARDSGADISIAPDGGAETNQAPDSAPIADGGASACPLGWRLVWSDEFEGAAGTAADSSKWVYESGNNSGWGNSELEYYRTGNANGALDGNGNLVITAKQETMSGFDYTSARMKTQGKGEWKYGHIEARIKIPFGQGLWPAFWLLGNDIGSKSWPGCGEIDVMENIGKEPNKIHGTMHGPGYSGGAGPTATASLTGNTRYADDFHIFAIEWEANVIRWYVDGELYSTKTPQDIGSGNTWVFDHPFFILLNVAVGGGWPGSPDNTTVFPQTMTVDYVRVCQL